MVNYGIIRDPDDGRAEDDPEKIRWPRPPKKGDPNLRDTWPAWPMAGDVYLPWKIDVVDAHVHLTDPKRIEYQPAALEYMKQVKGGPEFSLSDFIAWKEADGCERLSNIVFVESEPTDESAVDEALWIQEMIKAGSMVKAFVARAPLLKGPVAFQKWIDDIKARNGGELPRAMKVRGLRARSHPHRGRRRLSVPPRPPSTPPPPPASRACATTWSARRPRRSNLPNSSRRSRCCPGSTECTTAIGCGSPATRPMGRRILSTRTAI